MIVVVAKISDEAWAKIVQSRQGDEEALEKNVLTAMCHLFNAHVEVEIRHEK